MNIQYHLNYVVFIKDRVYMKLELYVKEPKKSGEFQVGNPVLIM